VKIWKVNSHKQACYFVASDFLSPSVLCRWLPKTLPIVSIFKNYKHHKIYLRETFCFLTNIFMLYEYLFLKRKKLKEVCMLYRTLKANSHIPRRSHDAPMPFPYHAVPLTVRVCLSHLIYTVRPCLIHTCHAALMPRPCHATTMPFWKRLLKATAQRGMGMAWRVWNSLGRPETACRRPARFRLLSATTRNSTKVVIRSIPIRQTVGLAFRIFPATTRTFTKNTEL
jgi:hypothetical protein